MRSFTGKQLAQDQHSPRAKLIRRALGITQEEFAAQFQIPLGTLRDWEQGAKEPERAARAYLRLIAQDPKAIRRALKWAQEKRAALRGFTE
jgi:putative transcriptional regulator